MELGPNASDADIKTAYRRLAKKYHPDRSGTRETREQFIAINEAYEVLMKRDEMVRDAIKRYQDKQKGRNPKQAKPFNARQRAKTHADMRYEEFVKSPIYKTAMVMDSAFDYIFLFLGFMMILAPFIGYVADTINPKNEDVEPEFHVLPIFLGAGFLYGVWYFLFRPKRLKQKQK